MNCLDLDNEGEHACDRSVDIYFDPRNVDRIHRFRLQWKMIYQLNL